MKNLDLGPGTYVTVTLFGLNYKGRVVRCIFENPAWLYDVQYADDHGELRRGEFAADELGGKQP